ncbi:hypothetical protein AB0A77_28230 [Streptomyces varsoviensis]|uniref:hypothetical protein n=1 Tax=Streptomyces varsoviensis TaxID=67373 RepID=UPI0033D7A106
MKTTRIIPGLTVDAAMYDAAAAGLAAHTGAESPLTWGRFTAPASWCLVPGPDGAAYKAEMVLRESIERTLKINIWYLPDRRGGAAPQPHSHPWPFTSHILLGGYSEDRYVAGDLASAEMGVEHRSGGANIIPRDLFHEVTAIHEPGRTLSLMVCGRGRRGSWGYLDPDTGQCTPVRPDPGFTDRFAALNPHISQR